MCAHISCAIQISHVPADFVMSLICHGSVAILPGYDMTMTVLKLSSCAVVQKTLVIARSVRRQNARLTARFVVMVARLPCGRSRGH